MCGYGLARALSVLFGGYIEVGIWTVKWTVNLAVDWKNSARS